MITIINDHCENGILNLNKVQVIFIDPPDNIGLKYNNYDDKKPDQDYYNWIENIILKSLLKCQIFWISYYWKHDLNIKKIVYDIIKYRHPSWKAKTFIWRFTFGQHNSKDFGSGFRFLLRLHNPLFITNVENIYEESARQLYGDSRANSLGRVPDDVFEYPRVCGNFKERRHWHPTQHPEALMEKIILSSSTENDTIVDLCAGSGTTLRVAEKLKRNSIGFEIDSFYCLKMNEELWTPSQK